MKRKVKKERWLFMKLIRPAKLAELLGISKTTLWRMEKAGELPQRYNISERTVGWLEEDIKEWLEKRKDNNANSEKTREV